MHFFASDFADSRNRDRICQQLQDELILKERQFNGLTQSNFDLLGLQQDQTYARLERQSLRSQLWLEIQCLPYAIALFNCSHTCTKSRSVYFSEDAIACK